MGINTNTLGISFKKRKKIIGPKMDPRGFGDGFVVGFGDDLMTSNTTLCSLSQMYFIKNFNKK